MRSGAAAGHHGYFHEAVVYDSDDHFQAVVLPFVTGGVAADEPTVVTLGDHNAGLIRAALPADTPVTFLAGGATYARPAAVIRGYRRLLAGHVAAGAGQIRIVGELPAAAFGPAWDSWARYESVINRAYDEFPVWTMCAYDARTTPEPMLADVERTHPRTARPHDRHEDNPAYVDPRTFLGEWRPVVPDRLQRDAPRVELSDPLPAEARQAVRAAATGVLTEEATGDLLIAVSETVTNALLHGRPPVRVRIWAGATRLVTTVTDRGDGPADPFAGLLPAAGPSLGGRGLWITHQASAHVALSRDESGFTVRLTAGDLESR
jgi:anti-sigma regulatory factor (Ser/Thr protein kinase)